MKTWTFSAAVGAVCLLGGCSEWKTNVTHGGITFNQVKVERSGLVVGELSQDQIVAGHLCRRGWVHLHPNGTLAAFTTAEPIDLGRFFIPTDTWVRQDERGVVTVCALPRDTLLQGFLCRGTGGPKGV